MLFRFRVGSEKWVCFNCDSQWSEEEFLEICGFQELDEIKFGEKITNYVNICKNNFLYDWPNLREYNKLLDKTWQFYGHEHYFRILLDLRLLNSLMTGILKRLQ